MPKFSFIDNILLFYVFFYMLYDIDNVYVTLKRGCSSVGERLSGRQEVGGSTPLISTRNLLKNIACKYYWLLGKVFLEELK